MFEKWPELDPRTAKVGDKAVLVYLGRPCTGVTSHSNQDGVNTYTVQTVGRKWITLVRGGDKLQVALDRSGFWGMVDPDVAASLSAKELVELRRTYPDLYPEEADDRCDYCKEHGIENCRHEGM
jgi:hypothetical protein